MKVLIEVPEQQAAALTWMARQSGKSRTALIREALTEYEAKYRNDITQFYGLWAGNAETRDGQAYLDAIRSEWDR